MVLCINKCGPFIDQITAQLKGIRNAPESQTDPQWMKDFKQGHTSMAVALAQNYAEKLNDHYEQNADNIRCQFQQRSMSTICAGRSQMCKKNS